MLIAANLPSFPWDAHICRRLSFLLLSFWQFAKLNLHMALRGVWQLNKLVVSYCNWGGSSRGIRYIYILTVFSSNEFMSIFIFMLLGAISFYLLGIWVYRFSKLSQSSLFVYNIANLQKYEAILGVLKRCSGIVHKSFIVLTFIHNMHFNKWINE